ncbi:MAG: hypothetical protein H6740_29010, partial [Alphaproteobacteria bacterium]|nr:hypothetical protein [Alphaproteobacteria bacterium]
MRLFLLLALTAGLSFAQEPSDPAPSAAKDNSAVEVSADLRAEYLHQEDMLVRFVVRNTGDAEATFADISARPWLVRFDITYPDGRTQPWYNTPPEVDPGQRWRVVPRGQRRALLKVPSSARLPEGDYALTVRIMDDQRELVLPTTNFSVTAPDPVGGEAGRDLGAAVSSGHQVAWLHKAHDGYDLYLHHSDGRAPTRTLGDYHLLHLDEAVDPVLTHARPTERWSRYIYWQSSPRRVEFVRLQGEGLGLAQEQPERFETPYPTVKLLGRGSTDARGGLHVPLWVPAPSGGAGEVSVASVRERSGVRFRRVVRLERPPEWMESAVDSNGDLRMLLGVDGNVDLYSLDGGSDLPAIGRRLAKAGGHPEGFEPSAARFGVLEAHGEQAGGLAILVLYMGEQQAEAVWYSLQGRELARIPGIPVTPGAEVLDMLPVSREEAVLLLRTPQGQTLVVPSGGAAKGVGRDEGVLLRDAKGQVYLRSLTKGGP